MPSAAHASTKRRSIKAASSPVAGEADEEEQAEIVPQLAVDAVVANGPHGTKPAAA